MKTIRTPINFKIFLWLSKRMVFFDVISLYLGFFQSKIYFKAKNKEEAFQSVNLNC